ncbi:7173_t:CDS:1 [Racocetra persica]|uniref:7173_t:CDS:1 n=1 Tax=Racocetra persica TaxID=160502 RepID=A0ACA9KF99_9GLOM|nr:7173_t:CDS:1 [Racocetra persica]
MSNKLQCEYMILIIFKYPSSEKKKKELEAIRSNRSVSSERKAAYPLAEEALNQWVVRLRQDSFIVLLSTIKCKMKELLKTSFQQVYSNVLETFEASNSWCQRFISRYNLVFWHYTKLEQKLLRDLAKQLEHFYEFIKKS